MALAFNYTNPVAIVVTVPQADLTLITGTLYELVTNSFRLLLHAEQASENGIVFDDAIRHNTEVTVAGTTFSRTIEMINGWSITFESLTYSVRLQGSNNNLFDVENNILNQNLVQVISQNSAGLVTVSSGSGLSAAQDAKLTNINTKTDPLTFTKPNEIDSNVHYVNDLLVEGSGTEADPWKPV